MRREAIWIAFLLVWCAVGTGGCAHCRLEYDRMAGTVFPQAQTVGGDTVDLESVYADSGMALDVQEDDTSIAALSGDSIRESELDTLETANRDGPLGPETYSCGFWVFEGTCTRYHLYGIVVDHYYEYDSGVVGKGIMGIMWTGDRRAFANFYKNSTVSSNAGKYLRSAAHEIGHAFNLHHEDGDGSTTIMNQTKVVGSSYVYEFSSTSLDHLSDHPDTCKWPGAGGTFYHCSTDHPPHVVQDCTD